ncbi:MAG TPA: cytochrome P460 family protein [Candidatus Nitrosotalea sp.]|nr:cytochrome P460 family protein [Candidatus Nitrosotalea sp.]
MENMTKHMLGFLSLMMFLPALPAADSATEAPAPTTDRVGFPLDYQQKFKVLRVVNKEKEMKIVTVYGNDLAASVTRTNDLPYPYGSIIVMETASAMKGSDGKPLLDAAGNFRREKVLGLHVMRREKGFGEAYGEKRSGEWEFVEFKVDGSYITPPQKSSSCAECHVKAGAAKDFVYHGRFASAGNP